MGMNKPVMAIMAILVSVLIVSTVAIPMIEDSGKELRDGANNSRFLYSTIETNKIDQNIEISEDKQTVTVNGYSINISSNIFATYSVLPAVIGNDFSIAVYNDGNGLNLRFAFYNDLTGAVNGTSATIDKSGLTIITDSGETVKKTISAKNMIVLSEKGTMGVFNNWAKIIVTPGDTIYAFTSAKQIAFGDSGKKANITLRTDITLNGNKEVTSKSTVFELKSTEKVELTKVDLSLTDSYNSVKDINEISNEKVKITANFGEEPVTTASADISNVSIIAPIHYTFIGENSNIWTTLLSIIPILLLLVPVFVAVAALKGRTD